MSEKDGARCACGHKQADHVAGWCHRCTCVGFNPAPQDEAGRMRSEVDASIPPGEIHFRQDGRTVYKIVGLAPPPPDQNCITLPDGSCVGKGCMHDAPPPDDAERCPKCDGSGLVPNGLPSNGPSPCPDCAPDPPPQEPDDAEAAAAVRALVTAMCSHAPVRQRAIHCERCLRQALRDFRERGEREALAELPPTHAGTLAERIREVRQAEHESRIAEIKWAEVAALKEAARRRCHLCKEDEPTVTRNSLGDRLWRHGGAAIVCAAPEEWDLIAEKEKHG